jgi:hypothetical protein
MWKNFVELGTPQMKIWRTRIARWIPKATKIHSQYVIPFAFPLQQRLQERASMSNLYVHCLSDQARLCVGSGRNVIAEVGF